MYKFSYFTEKDTNKLIAFMQQNSFATLTGAGDAYPVATQIPLEIMVADNGVLTLSGHLMKNTDHHKAFLKNPQVLVIFNGPHCYVSAAWYGNPKTASTWNYMTVQAKGKIIFSDEEGTYAAIKSLTNKYESGESAATFNSMPIEYIQPLLKAIIGFTITIESLDNIFKLSQNKTQKEQLNIIAHLKKSLKRALPKLPQKWKPYSTVGKPKICTNRNH